MSKEFLSTTAEIINGIWGIGSEVYHTVSDEIGEAIDSEAMERTRRYFRDRNFDENSSVFQRRYQAERAVVAKEFKSVAVKGGLIAMGLGWFV